MNASVATQFVRKLMEAEFYAGFPFVRRMPSTDTWKILDYVELLTPEERHVLFDVLAERGSCWLQSEVDYERQKELVHHPAYQRYTCRVGQPWPWKYADPSFLRQMLDVHRQLAASQPTPRLPPDFGSTPLSVIANAEPPTPASAAEIRKVVKQVFVERFDVKPTNVGSGIWNYPGEYDGRPFTLTLNWGRIFKLRYSISPCHFQPHQQFHGVNGLTWEGMLGLGMGHWDFVCQHNLARSVELLGEIVKKMVMLPEQLGLPGPT